MKELKSFQVENEHLKRQCEEGEKKLKSYYRKKYEELKEEHAKVKEKWESIRGMKENRSELEKELHESKKKMADILNYAITKNISSLAEEFYGIYEGDEVS